MVKILLSDYQRLKFDDSSDLLFYAKPRFVHHLDLSFRLRLTKLYESIIKQESIILDLMSSWVSHLPDIRYKSVIGHGMNKFELENNKQIDSYWIQDLNNNHKLPLENNSIDYCLLVAGWQYLQYPEIISSEVLRVIRPNGRFIISFSNRAFWNKAPNIWLESNEKQRINYISDVLEAQGWNIDKVYSESLRTTSLLGLFSTPSDPFYSVVGIKNNNIL